MASHDAGYWGQGTTLSMKIAGTFTLVGELVDIEGPDIKVNFRNPNKLDTATVRKRPTLVDLGKYKFTVNFDPNGAEHTLIKGRALTPVQTPDEFKVTYPDGLTTHYFDDFKGFVGSWKEKGFNDKDTITAEFEIEVTDLFTMNAGVA